MGSQIDAHVPLEMDTTKILHPTRRAATSLLPLPVAQNVSTYHASLAVHVALSSLEALAEEGSDHRERRAIHPGDKGRSQEGVQGALRLRRLGDDPNQSVNLQ